MTPTPSPLSLEPAAVSELVRVVLIALVAVGWVAWDEPAIMAVATAAGAVASVAMSVWTRSTVTPVARFDDETTLK